ncbi:uncharacterized protein LOC118198680 [Stegodyphus dumicola]|uniref:uncharacterized protein LOC118198680 n=1 Tax=Stegodyphus dumicola TaxID=202533 RepID=UPI0015B05210|nr:uncharacterized protein LOC118198680 [Stegodyphus dumicola]
MKRCPDCDRLCRSSDCFDFHKSVRGQQIFSFCDLIYQCRKCCQVIQRRKCPRENHRCGTTICNSCKKYVVAGEHQCFLGKTEPKDPSDLHIFFDFETDQTSGEHVVNLAVAQYADGQEQVFKGYTACQDFCAWLFAPNHKGFTAIAHNMKG